MSAFSVRRAAAEAPDAPALDLAGEILSYRELAGRVEREARRLAPLLAGRAGALLTPRPTAPSLSRLLALFELGLPVRLMHPRLPPGEREALAGHLPDFENLDRDGADDLPAPGPTPLPATPADDHRPLVIVSTSGSGGRPRGVVLSRGGLRFAVAASGRRLGWQPADRWLLALPLAHVGGLSVLLRCLAARRCMVVPADLSPTTLAGLLGGGRVSLASLVPTQLRQILAADPALEGRPPLRAILLGGAAADPALLTQAALRRLPVLVTYGLSEAGSQVATRLPGTPPDADEGAGPPLPGYELRIGGDGRIQVRSPSLLTGYQPPDPEAPLPDAEGWLTTSDLGRIDERGRLHPLGRADAVLISGGENVCPEQVEATLLAHPAVAECLVFGVEDSTWGQRVAALLVARADPPPPALFEQWLTEHLPAYARPRLLRWVEALPRTAGGKLSRHRARASFQRRD
ncbi:MAG: AMP-binding protein [Acidobacteriota bacterium]|nr:AMP-binding protein [Acidobacteriota bacterium]